MLKELLEKYNLEPKCVIKAEQTLTCLALTIAGAGVSLVTEGTLRCGHFEGDVVRYFADEGICTRTLNAVRPKNRLASRAAVAFMDVLKETSIRSS